MEPKLRAVGLSQGREATAPADTAQYWTAVMDLAGSFKLAGDAGGVLVYPQWRVAVGRLGREKVPEHLWQLLGCGYAVTHG